MKRTIGFILLALVLALLIGVTCYVCGWKLGLRVWGIGFALALIVDIAMFLIEDGE
jgi:hypothetical protein